MQRMGKTLNNIIKKATAPANTPDSCTHNEKYLCVRVCVCVTKINVSNIYNTVYMEAPV